MPNYYGLTGGSVPRVGPVTATYPNGVPLGASVGPSKLECGDSVWLFGLVPAANAGGADDALIKGEQPAAPQASIPVCIVEPDGSGPAPMICIEISFYSTGTLTPAAPGAFNIQIQEADTDADAFYITPAAPAYTVTAVNANNKARVDLNPTGGKFLRALISSRGNAVDCVIKASRIA